MTLMIRAFNDSDLKEIQSWYTERGVSLNAMRWLPRSGYIVPGIAAGFCFETDTPIGLLEGFVTNPKAHSAERHWAIREITARLIEDAGSKGIRQVIAITKVPSFMVRLRHDYGFEDLGSFRVFSKEI